MEAANSRLRHLPTPSLISPTAATGIFFRVRREKRSRSAYVKTVILHPFPVEPVVNRGTRVISRQAFKLRLVGVVWRGMPSSAVDET